MAVASLNSLCVGKEWRFVDQLDRDDRECHGDQFANADGHACEVKDDVFDQSHLARGGYDLVVHEKFSNFHKTRYKTMSTSSGSVHSIMSTLYGKWTHLSFSVRALGGVSGVFSGFKGRKSGLTTGVPVRIGGLSC